MDENAALPQYRFSGTVSCVCGKSVWPLPPPEKELVRVPVDCEHCGRQWFLKRYPGGRAELRMRRRESPPMAINEARRRGRSDASMDRYENAPFGSVGGIDKRTDMTAPYYIAEEDQKQYLDGYRAQCLEMFGEGWETCEFGWIPVLEIGDDDVE